MSVNNVGDFMLPFRWKKKQPPKAKFTIADEPTLTKILSSTTRPQPEFQGKEYIRGLNNTEEDQKLFKCNEPGCNRLFTNETSLKCHFNTHLDRRMKCSFCDAIFKTDGERSKHLNQFHPDLETNPEANPLQCVKCNKVSRDKKALWRHVRETHRDQPYPCPHCAFPFTSPDNLKEHLRHKHLPEDVPAQKFTCDVCGKVYAHKNTLRSHIKFNHRGEEEGSYKCVLCDIVYDKKISYKRHMKRHVNPSFHPCKVCNVQFRNSSHLKRHFESWQHKEVARKRLGKNYSEEETVPPTEPEVGSPLQENITKSFTNDELIELCKTKFARIFLHRVDFANVRNSNYQSKPSTQASEERKAFHLKCIYCSQSLPDLEGVKKHELICLMKMKNKKLHICPQCNKEFKNAYDLVKHSRVHSDDRSVPCSHCDAKFKCNSTKVQHEKAVHFGIRWTPKVPRVFCCNHQGCTKQYATEKSLKVHIASIHLLTKYPCETCGRIFKRSDNFQKHVRKDHAENSTFLLCKACNRTYKSKAALLSHFRTKRHLRKAKELGRRRKSGNKRGND